MSNLCIGIFRWVCIELFGCVSVGFFCPTQKVYSHTEKSPLPVKGCKIWLILDTLVSSLACDTFCLTQPFACLTNVLTDFPHHEYLKCKLANSYTATEIEIGGVYMKGNLFLVSLQCIGIGSKMRNFRCVSNVHIFKMFFNMLLKFKIMAKELHEKNIFLSTKQ